MRLPDRLTRLGTPYNTLLGVHLRRPLLRRRLLRATAGLPDDVTVVIGHRNRADYRLTNGIRSIQAQRYPGGKVHPLVVDYGSSPEQQAKVRALAGSLGAECIGPPGEREWNRSHCLNIGLRQTRTKFVLLTDVDILFAEDFVATMVEELRREPLTAIYSYMLHLPESCSAELERAARDGSRIDLAALKPLAKIKTADPYSTGTVGSYTWFFEEMRGYDEFYRAYGVEDTDVAQRFLRLGLRHRSIAERTFYLHQWHPRFEGVQSDSLQDTIKRNVAYFDHNLSIVRNPSGWGEPH